MRVVGGDDPEMGEAPERPILARQKDPLSFGAFCLRQVHMHADPPALFRSKFPSARNGNTPIQQRVGDNWHDLCPIGEQMLPGLTYANSRRIELLE